MYEAFFGFHQRPFAAVPRVDHYFPAAAIENARQSLIRCVARGEGTGVVVGPAGTGKTLLCQALAQHFRDQFPVAMLSSGRLGTRRALLQAILHALGRPFRGMDEGDLQLALVDYLTAGEEAPAAVLLLVDEAHTLPLRLVDELRVLTNLTNGSQPRFRLVLAGACVLEERLASPKLDSFSQRIVSRCYLESFNRSETLAYIHARIEGSGGNPAEIFPDEARQRVFQATDGVPRLINQVCDHALLLAYVAGRRAVAPALIEEAWGDLQQLPAPAGAACRQAENAASVIEFGRLEDLPGDDNAAALAAAADQQPEGGAGCQPADSPMRVAAEADSELAQPTEPAEQIDRIEQMIHQAEGDFQPGGLVGPEVELVFDEADHPFQDEFDHEEVVADRCVAPGAAQASPDDLSDATAQREPDAEPDTVPLCRQDAHLRHDAGDDAPTDDDDVLIVEADEHDRPPPSRRSTLPVRHKQFGRLFAKLRWG